MSNCGWRYDDASVLLKEVMPGPLRIGELAARTGRSVHTIR
jgi:hypothetical protein